MELYRNPRNQFVAGFIGSPRMNFLPVRSEGTNSHERTLTLSDGTTLNLTAPDPHHQIATLGIRPEHISFTSAANGLPAQVQMVERLGGESYVYAETRGKESLIVRASGEVDLKPGQEVHLTLNPAHLHLFDERGDAIPTSQQSPTPVHPAGAVPQVNQ